MSIVTQLVQFFKDKGIDLEQEDTPITNSDAVGEERKILVNSKTTGDFRTETWQGREWIVTNSKLIQGDTVMNKIFYPDSELSRSFEQLDNIISFNGHPVLNGQPLPETHPLAVNLYNIGGMFRKPTKDHTNVFAEFWLDKEIANSTEPGREHIKRIENGERIGVSTGLIARLENGVGKGADGVDYDMTARDMRFQHVATLLDEKPAGDHVNTALMNKETLICNMESLDTKDKPNETAGEQETHEQEITNMEIPEMVEALKKEGYLVVENAADKIPISEEDHKILENIKAEKEAALANKREECVKATGLTEDECAALTIDAMEKMIKLANDAKGSDAALRNGNAGAGDSKKPEATADSIRAICNQEG
jgi:hypothetical protein